MLIVDRQTGRAVCTEPIERMDGDAAPCECTFAQLVVSVDGYHDEATKSLLTDCCSTCCHTIAAAETQFAALAGQIRSFQSEHGLPDCR